MDMVQAKAERNYADLVQTDEVFPSASYQYVLYGMGFKPRYDDGQGALKAQERTRVDKLLHANGERSRQMLGLLPTNRELVSAMTSLRGVA